MIDKETERRLLAAQYNAAVQRATRVIMPQIQALVQEWQPAIHADVALSLASSLVATLVNHGHDRDKVLAIVRETVDRTCSAQTIGALNQKH